MTGQADAQLRQRLVGEVDAFMQQERREHPEPIPAGDVAALVAYQRRLHAAGLAVPTWPREFGGRGLAPSDALAITTRLGEVGAPELINFVGIDVLSPALQRYVDADRLQRWLPPMANADEIWCQLFSEPDAGSDLAALRTTARPTGSGWRVSGQKVWSTWGHYARWGLLLARTGSRESRHRGISAFVVDMRSPGITVRPLQTMTGEVEFAEVFLDDVEVLPDQLVGDVDAGWDVTAHILGSERGPYAIRRASVLRGALTRLLDRARAHSNTADDTEAVVEAVLAMEQLDRRVEEVAAQVQRGEPPGPEAALTKLLLSSAEQQIAGAAHRLAGVDGLVWEGEQPDVVTAYLYSRAASIYGGTEQIQLNIIAERLLGLPREPIGARASV